MAPGQQFCFRIPSIIEEGAKIQEHILHLVEQLEYPPRHLFGIRLALEEAVINAIRHGNRLDAAKQVHIQGEVGPDRVYIEVTDEGGGFDPEAVPDPTDDENLDKPSGRGIVLMRSFMTSVSFNEAGNSVTLLKLRAEDDGHAS